MLYLEIYATYANHAKIFAQGEEISSFQLARSWNLPDDGHTQFGEAKLHHFSLSFSEANQHRFKCWGQRVTDKVVPDG